MKLRNLTLASLLLAPVLLILPQLVSANTCGFGSDIGGGMCRGFLTAGSSWTVPSDWSSSNNTIEIIGGGGGGADLSTCNNDAKGTGGGGGAYSKVVNVALTPGSAVSYSVGGGGQAGDNGGDTWFKSSSIALAKGGGGGICFSYGAPGAPGGQANSGVGSVRYSGGSATLNSPEDDSAATSGGGAAGPHGDGGISNDLNPRPWLGGAGDAGYGGAGGGGLGTNPTISGGNGSEYGGYGSGGGGGYNGDTYVVYGGSGGNYGGGGASSNDYTGFTGVGGPGLIVITYASTGSSSAISCSVTFDENPLTDSSTTIHWTSSGATLFYINNIGYVGASGSATVFSAGDYSGTVTGPGGNGSCAAVLQSPSGDLCPNGSAVPNGDPNQCSCAQGDQNACENTCPSGQTWNGSQCVAGCQIGYVLQNGECVFDQCPLNYTQSVDQNGDPICVFNQCPVGYVLQNGQCVFQSCPIGYTQQGTQCVFQGCPTGYTMQGNFCVPITIQAPSADIVAVPSLIKQGQTSNISWSAANVSACAISGTNGDSWSCTAGACDATTTKTSSPIQSQTIYNLSCTGLDSSTLQQSVTISVVPKFCEPGAPGCN